MRLLGVIVSSFRLSSRIIDGSGVLLERVCHPIREYLRDRDDTVRCIVNGLTGDDSSSLFEEVGSHCNLTHHDWFAVSRCLCSAMMGLVFQGQSTRR
jgi:hypothetical protein